MTEKEAIEIINDVTWKDFGRHPDFPEARDMAKAALEKQISKKPKKMNYKPLVDFGWEYACAICGCAVGAVSYTHLDVYKRQPHRNWWNI